MLRDLSMEKVLATKLQNSLTIRQHFTSLLLDEVNNSDIISALAGKDDFNEQELEHYQRLLRASIRYMTL